MKAKAQTQTHQCAALGCTDTIPNFQAFCGKHWSEVPYSIRQRISSHYQALCRARSGNEKMRARTALNSAVRDGMVFVREIEGDAS